MAVLLLLLAVPAVAQQQVRIALPPGVGAAAIAGTYRSPVSAVPAPAAVLLHGCGGIGQNHLRMAERLQQLGYAALLPDSFGARRISDACTRNWPTPADAEQRAHDIDAAVDWLAGRREIAADRIAVIGYSYGGGVLLMRALESRTPPRWRAAIAVYPDCALADRGHVPVVLRRPMLWALAELDDWTPVWQCTALLERLGADRAQIEVQQYAGAHHSFDAVGLSVRYLAAAGNRSKPQGCCGAHYGHHPAAWRQFTLDVERFLARTLAP